MTAKLRKSVQWRDTTMSSLLEPAFEEIAPHARRHQPAALELPASQPGHSPARIAELESAVDCPTAIGR